jgi:hypothetical protein
LHNFSLNNTSSIVKSNKRVFIFTIKQFLTQSTRNWRPIDHILIIRANHFHGTPISVIHIIYFRLNSLRNNLIITTDSIFSNQGKNSIKARVSLRNYSRLQYWFWWRRGRRSKGKIIRKTLTSSEKVANAVNQNGERRHSDI